VDDGGRVQLAGEALTAVPSYGLERQYVTAPGGGVRGALPDKLALCAGER
jgi:hypothetical protein